MTAILDTSKLIVGASGSGKTVTAKAEVAQLLEQRRHVAIIDPTGVWWGMRSGREGQKGGFALPIFGGAHGDIEIRPDMGAAIARILLAERASGIVDLSVIDNSRDWRVFMADFVAELRRGVAGNFHLVVDEADEFAAERVADDIGFGLRENLIWIAKRGRAQGFVPTWITQRTAEIAKAVISQAQTIIAHQLVAPTDRKAIDDYLRGNGSADARRSVMESLAELQVGERWIYSPRLKLLERGMTPALTTFDSSRTPAPGETIAAPRTLAELDVSAIAAALGGATDASPADRIPHDPREAFDKGSTVGTLLTKREDRIADLEAANALLTETAAELGVERNSARLRLKNVGAAIDAAISGLQAARRKIDRELIDVDADMHSDDANMHSGDADLQVADAGSSVPKSGRTRRAPGPRKNAVGAAEATLTTTARDVAAMLLGAAPAGISWDDALLLTGRRPGSGDAGKARAQLLDATRSGGPLASIEGGQFFAAPALLEQTDIDVGHWPGPCELVDLWAAKLRGPGGDILRDLAAHGPSSRADVGARIGKAVGSGWFGKGMKDLRRSNLVEERAPGVLHLHPFLQEQS